MQTKKSLLRKLIPLNYLEEKEKFFSNKSYNPQFRYTEIIPQEQLAKYGFCEESVIDKADHILDKTFFDSSEEELLVKEGKLLTKQQVTDKIQHYLQDHSIDQLYSLRFSDDRPARTTMTMSEIILREPVVFREEGLQGMLHHELGTHALRGINYEKQPWYQKKEEFGFSEYLPTEEGLASLHALYAHTHPSMYIHALRYVTVAKAQTSSFVETWDYVSQYVSDSERLWSIVFRQKRGLVDTSLPGGYTKDLVYFKGMIDVWQWLQQHGFALEDVYLGKLSLQDVEYARELNRDYATILPNFYAEDRDAYAEKIANIGGWNEL